MADITKQTIYGDLEVSRNLITGGRLDVTGKAAFGGNVKVEGFLDAPNLKVPFKGIFSSEEQLKTGVPRPLNGWCAYVAADTEAGAQSTDDNVTYKVYRAYGGEWIDTGNTTYLTVKTDIEDVTQLVTTLEDNVGEIKSMASGNADKIAEMDDAIDGLVETVNGKGDDDAGLVGDVAELKKRVTAAETDIGNKLDKTDVYDGLDAEETGKALDATQGAELDKKIQDLADAIKEIIGDGTGEGDSLASLKLLIELLQDGKWGGSVRFNGLTTLGKSKLVDGMFAGESIEGIIWLLDKKMFVACDATVVIDCGCEKVVRTYYTDWDGSRFFMENVGTEGGLWKEKIYIHNGALYVWKECEKQLVKASGTNDNIITDEEIDEILEDFEFVEIGNPLYKITAKGDTLLYLDAEQNGGEALVKGKVDIKDVTEKDVLQMFEDAEKKLNE